MIKTLVVGLMEGQKASPSVIIIYPTLIIATRDSTPYFLREKIELKKKSRSITYTPLGGDYLHYKIMGFLKLSVSSF